MITIQHEGRLITAGIYGEFTVTDYRQFEQEVLETLRVQGQVDLLVDLRDMLSYTLDVAWEDVKFVREHAHDFRRVAVISDDQWTVWLAWLTRLMVDAEVRVFDEEPLAREWLDAASADALRAQNFTTLISIADLAQRLDDPDVVIFDCRHDLMKPDVGAQLYAKSHIPGARFASVDRDLAGPLTGKNGRHPLPDAEQVHRVARQPGRLERRPRWSATTAAAACTRHGCGGCSSTGSATSASPCWTAAGTSGSVPASRSRDAVPKPEGDDVLGQAHGLHRHGRSGARAPAASRTCR